jgi:hypothetical protein
VALPEMHKLENHPALAPFVQESWENLRRMTLHSRSQHGYFTAASVMARSGYWWSHCSEM